MRDDLFLNNDEANKDFSLRLRVSMKEKREFYAVCAMKGMTPSKVMRQMMKEYVRQYKEKGTNLL